MLELNTRIVLRNDTREVWESIKDIATLMPGEMGVEIDTGYFKIGKEKEDGSLYTWAELDYANGKIYDLLAEITAGKAQIKLKSNEEGDAEDVITILQGDNITITKGDNGEIVISAKDTTYSNGNGLKLNGNQFSVKSGSAHIIVTEDGVTVGTAPVYETVTVDGKPVKQLKTPGTGLFEVVYTKQETLDKIAEKITEINGGESAGEVLSQLNSYKETNDQRVDSLETAVNGKPATEGQPKVPGLVERVTNLEEAGADDNVIEKIVVQDKELPVEDKTVTLPLAMLDQAGLVKSSTAENGILVAADGTMSVNSINVNKLVQTPGEWLVLKGGGAST